MLKHVRRIGHSSWGHGVVKAEKVDGREGGKRRGRGGRDEGGESMPRAELPLVEGMSTLPSPRPIHLPLPVHPDESTPPFPSDLACFFPCTAPPTLAF